jgi:hypothetical protein
MNQLLVSPEHEHTAATALAELVFYLKSIN